MWGEGAALIERGIEKWPVERRLGQAPPDSSGGVQQARTPQMRSYPRRTTYLYASDTDRWSRPVNRVRAPPVSIGGVQKTYTPRLSLHPGRTCFLYATDADSRVPPLYVISLFHYIMGLTYFLFFSFHFLASFLSFPVFIGDRFIS
jgi:hypothetical protein